MSFFFFSSRRRHTRFSRDWSSDVCSSDLGEAVAMPMEPLEFADRAGTLAAIAKVIETGSMPARFSSGEDNLNSLALVQATILSRSEERRVGKECRVRV